MKKNFKVGYFVVLISDWGGKAEVYKIDELKDESASLYNAEGKYKGWYLLSELHRVYNEDVQEKVVRMWTTNFI